MEGAIITEKQADELRLIKYDSVCFFNPLQDINNNWFISKIQVEKCDYLILKELTIVEIELPIMRLPI